MRTTVNIDNDLLAEAKVLAVRRSQSLGDVVDDALRRMLNDQDQPAKAEFRWRDVAVDVPGDKGLRPGVNWRSNSAMLDLVEDL